MLVKSQHLFSCHERNEDCFGKRRSSTPSGSVCYHTPELTYDRIGLSGLPEFPFALESRLMSRWDVQKYAREAYDMGIRYIGACRGFEPYRVRAIAEEVTSPSR